jgi:pimeloyl-ACP methyl ester carboxylesterase
MGTDDTALFSMAAHADRIGRLLDALRISRACLVTHGVGAQIGLAVAATNPGRTSGLCLVNPIARPAWPSRQVGVARAAIPFLGAMPQRMVLALIRRRLRHAYADSRRFAHSIDQYLRPFSAPGGARRLIGHLRAATSFSPPVVPASLPRTTIVAGRQDPVMPLHLVQRLTEMIPDATLEPIDTGHFAPEESPEYVAVALGKLLANEVVTGV